MWGDDTVGTIIFGSSNGYTNVNAASVTGSDSQGKTWTVTTAGTTSFTPNQSYAQIGSAKKPASSITFTATIAATDVIIKSFSAKFGGFGETAGTVTLKVGDTTVGTGSLNEGSDVTVSNSTTGTGKVLTVTVTGISKGVKAYNISYSYTTVSSGEETTTTINASGITNTNVFEGTAAGSLSASVTYGSPASAVPEASVTWSGDNDDVATINASTGVVTLVGAGTVIFTATYDGVEDEFSSSSDTYEMTVTNEDPNIETIWSEDFSEEGYNTRKSTYGYTLSSGSYVASNAYAGGNSPEMMVAKNNGTFSATIPLNYGYTGDLTMTYKTNAKALAISSTTTGVSMKGTSSFNTEGTHTVTFQGVTSSMASLTIIFTATTSENVRLDDIVLKGTRAPSYNITATRNDNSYGTVNVSGITITATPATGYRVIAGDGGFTLIGGTASVTNNGDNTFTVVASTDCTVQINFEEIPKYTVTFNAEGGSCATSSLTESVGGEGVTLPTPTISVAGWEFVGWAESKVSNTTTMPTLFAAGATFYPSNNTTTLHAVYTLAETTSTFVRVTSASQIEFAKKIVIVKNSDNYVLNHNLTTNVAAPSETLGEITAPANTIFTLSGNNTAGFVLTGANGTLSQTTLATSGSDQNVDWSGNNNHWTVVSNAYASELFSLCNATNVALEYWSGWKTEYTTSYTNRSYTAMKLYIPKTAYDSNPSAIINPTVAFTKAGNKSLYVKDESSYTNAATVNVSKTVTYSSSDATVATVSDAGVVTALKSGSATITATVAAEVGVSTEASASYVVTVKDAKTIAGLKAITSSSSTVSFTADLTDAIVTYVNGDYAYIQDASGAVYASCGSSLTAGKKINGAVSGSIKAANQIDEITAIDLSEATVTDSDIPAATVITAVTLAANKADYEGKLVRITDATITASLTSGSASGGKISDDNKTTEINLYAPKSNIEALKDAEGTFNGYISLFNGNTLRFNIYEQSQISLTKNAPTAQTLTFANDAVELDEGTDDFNDFAGQTVSGARGTVTYALTGDAIGTVNENSGAFTLNGTYGTATITATAAAAEVTEAGVTTPYTATSESYTVTVYPRYTVTFNINGTADARQTIHGTLIEIPSPAAVGDYVFRGWSTTTVAAADDEPSMTEVTNAPTANATYYAVYALAAIGDPVEHTSTLTVARSSAPTSPYVSDGSSWTWSNLTFTTTNNGACINKNNGSVTFTLPSGGKAKSLTITKTGNSWATAASVVLKDASSNTVNTFTGSSLSFTFTAGTYDQSTSYTLTNTTGSNAWVDHITFVYTVDGINYSNYCTSLPEVEVTIPSSKFLSFCYGRALDFSDTDVKAYKAAVSDDKVTLTKVDVVPANEGVILYCENPDTYTINVTDKTVSDVTGNEMVGVLRRTQVYWTSDDKYNYILQSGVFNMANGGYLKGNRAYLHTTYDVSSSDVRTFTIVFDDDETGINAIKDEQVNGAIYNLAGQRLNKPQKGINIINGKKVLVK